jgi:acylglycerol lipase
MDCESRFETRDGLDLYERNWRPEGAPRAHVVLIHGYGEHCSRYEEMAKTLNRDGIAVHTYDQRGFGHSPGKRGYVADFDLLLDDLDDYLAHITPRIKEVPCFVMGHSFGGLVLACYGGKRTASMRGLIFSSPFLGFVDSVPAVLVALVNVLSVIAPWVPIQSVDASKISRDPDILRIAETDPLSFHGKVAARTGAEFTAAFKRARANLASITNPIYVVHGSNDLIVPIAGSHEIHTGCSSEDRTLKIYEGGYHELWNDLVKKEFAQGISEWILKRI